MRYACAMWVRCVCVPSGPAAVRCARVMRVGADAWSSCPARPFPGAQAFLDLTSTVESQLPRDAEARRGLCEAANSRADTLCMPALDPSIESDCRLAVAAGIVARLRDVISKELHYTVGAPA
jgi:hypothetical protein